MRNLDEENDWRGRINGLGLHDCGLALAREMIVILNVWMLGNSIVEIQLRSAP